ncbi:hypothetical protein [Nostoc sp.]
MPAAGYANAGNQRCSCGDNRAIGVLGSNRCDRISTYADKI